MPNLSDVAFATVLPLTPIALIPSIRQLTRIYFPGGTFAAYAYDALGRRIQKNVNGTVTRYVYDNEDILLEYDGNNVVQARYTHGPGVDEPWLLERDLNANGLFDADEVFEYHADGLGSIVALTDATGAPVRTYRYDTFGNLLAETGTLAQPYGFTGREFDQESGLYYYRARYYEPRIGRFLQEDPIRGILELPSTQNLYPYALNNPTNRVDPDGQFSAAVALALVGGIITATFITLFVLGTKSTMEKADRIRARQGSCDLDGVIAADEDLRDLVQQEAIPKAALGAVAAQASQAATTDDQLLFLGQEIGAVVGEKIERRKH